MSYYDPQIITLRLSPAFLRTLKDETEWAHLADGIHTSIPDSLLQLADFVLAELEPVGVTFSTTESRNSQKAITENVPKGDAVSYDQS